VRVGSLDVTILVDGEGSFATIGDAFPALSSGEEWRLPVNAVLVRGAGPTVLIDTGLGPEPRAFMPDAGARLLAELARAGVSPAEVDLVVHTHLHVDHVGWDGSFPNARYVVSAAEWSYFMSEESLTQRPHLRDRVEPLGEAGSVDLVDGELELAAGVRSAATRKQVLGQLADRGTDVIVGHFHGPGRFNRQGEGFSWSSLAEEGEPAVE
jgi:glyoxylase-like metal-dependent hydrolase (beta-lactamase superfamily II)